MQITSPKLESNSENEIREFTKKKSLLHEAVLQAVDELPPATPDDGPYGRIKDFQEKTAMMAASNELMVLKSLLQTPANDDWLRELSYHAQEDIIAAIEITRERHQNVLDTLNIEYDKIALAFSRVPNRWEDSEFLMKVNPLIHQNKLQREVIIVLDQTKDNLLRIFTSEMGTKRK